MKKTLIILAALLLVAGIASASNTGFKLNYELKVNTSGVGTNLNFVSAPYFFFPDGNVGQLPQNDSGWCNDLNTTTSPPDVVLNIQRFNANDDSFTTHACNSPFSQFDLEVGKGYALVPATAGPVTVSIVGSHDDNYAHNKVTSQTDIPLILNATGTSLNFVSVPYHVVANDAKMLCDDVNRDNLPAGDVQNIQRFNTASDSFTTNACVGIFSQFDVAPGESYAFVPATAGVGISFEVY